MLEVVHSVEQDYDPLWGSTLKQAIRRVYPGFNESYYGYGSFSELAGRHQGRGPDRVGIRRQPRQLQGAGEEMTCTMRRSRRRERSAYGPRPTPRPISPLCGPGDSRADLPCRGNQVRCRSGASKSFPDSLWWGSLRSTHPTTFGTDASGICPPV